MMSWIPKSRPTSTSPHKKGAPLHLKANLYFLCCYNFLCFFSVSSIELHLLHLKVNYLLFLFCFLLLQFSLFFHFICLNFSMTKYSPANFRLFCSQNLLFLFSIWSLFSCWWFPFWLSLLFVILQISLSRDWGFRWEKRFSPVSDDFSEFPRCPSDKERTCQLPKLFHPLSFLYILHLLYCMFDKSVHKVILDMIQVAG